MLRRQWRKSESDPGNGSGGQQGSVVVGGGEVGGGVGGHGSSHCEVEGLQALEI